MNVVRAMFLNSCVKMTINIFCDRLTALVRDVNPETRRKGTYFDFALVQPEPFGPGYRMRDIGVTCSGQRNADDTLTLAQAKFNIGDYMDINITPPNRVPPQRRPRAY